MELKLPVADPAPYPPIRVQGPSPACLRAMLQNLGGGESEMTAVAQYFYNCTVLAPSHPKASEYFHAIAVVEMRHLSIFAQLVQLLGGDPRLWSYSGGRTAYWNPGALTYSRELPVLLNRAITAENRTITEYRRLAKELQDPCIQAILERLILDEDRHVYIFRCLAKEISH